LIVVSIMSAYYDDHVVVVETVAEFAFSGTKTVLSEPYVSVVQPDKPLHVFKPVMGREHWPVDATVIPVITLFATVKLGVTPHASKSIRACNMSHNAM